MTKMMTLWHCPHCDSTNVGADAFVHLNDTDEATVYDAQQCLDCDYDGHMFEQREVDVEGTDNEYLFNHLTNAEKIEAIGKVLAGAQHTSILIENINAILNR